MDDIAMMAQLSINGGTTWLKAGTHYMIDGGRLYIDLPVLFTTYGLYKNACRERRVIDDPNQFRQLISQEPYFVTAHSVDGMKLLQIDRAVLELDLDKMQAKGLDTSLYG